MFSSSKSRKALHHIRQRQPLPSKLSKESFDDVKKFQEILNNLRRNSTSSNNSKSILKGLFNKSEEN
jgi:hypothetical protein